MRKLQATSALSHLSGIYVPLSLCISLRDRTSEPIIFLNLTFRWSVPRIKSFIFIRQCRASFQSNIRSMAAWSLKVIVIRYGPWIVEESLHFCPITQSIVAIQFNTAILKYESNLDAFSNFPATFYTLPPPHHSPHHCKSVYNFHSLGIISAC